MFTGSNTSTTATTTAATTLEHLLDAVDLGAKAVAVGAMLAGVLKLGLHVEEAGG